MVTHTADCNDCDFRLAKVPAKDWPEGSKRPVVLFHTEYPVRLSKERSFTWSPENLDDLPQKADWLAGESRASTIVGYIDQVPHTYALFEGSYGMMNEHKVSIGESTCASIFWAKPRTEKGGMALFEAGELSRIALERTTSAREAIQLMGDLAVQHGFYSAEYQDDTLPSDMGEGAETLTVADGDEAWVFHVMPDDSGASAIWVAQKVTPGQYTVIANQFIIREVIPGHPDFMYSNNMWDIAKKHNLWDPKEDDLLDFTETFAPVRAHAPYATRRVWRTFNLLSPSISLPPNTDAFGSDYNFSYAPDAKISHHDLMRVNRDHYEGTEFDLTKGLAGGPYGDPSRFDVSAEGNMSFYQAMQGSFERAISMFRTSYSFIGKVYKHDKRENAHIWYSQAAPHTGAYIPLFLNLEDTSLKHVGKGSLFQYRDDVFFWVFNSLSSHINRFYRFTQPIVEEQQHALEKGMGDEEVANVRSKIRETEDVDKLTSITTHSALKVQEKVLEAWKDLASRLYTQIHDGYIFDVSSVAIGIKKLFYDYDFLVAVGYFSDNNKPFPGGIYADANPTMNEQEEEDAQKSSLILSHLELTLSLAGVAVLFFGMGLMVMKYTVHPSKGQRPRVRRI
jgi:dipeptidase